MDASGDVIVCGASRGTIDGVTAAGLSDYLIMKFDSAGVWQWTVMRGTTSDDFAVDVTLDSAGNIIVVGETYGGMDGFTNLGCSSGFMV